MHNLSLKDMAKLHKEQKSERKVYREIAQKCDNLVLKQAKFVPKDKRK